jgi:hypothetical protein
MTRFYTNPVSPTAGASRSWEEDDAMIARRRPRSPTGALTGSRDTDGGLGCPTRPEHLFTESLILAQDERWRRA